jgi:hypothetical protein
MLNKSTISEIFKSQFKKELEKSNTPPFLFAGSGLSIRYYNIPTWIELLNEFVLLHKNHFIYEFGYYSSKCNRDPLKIASMLAFEFHEVWWRDKQFKKSRIEFEKIAGLNSEIAFKIELSKLILSKKKLNPTYKKELEILSKSILSGVLTTNWDDFLQNLFLDLNVKIGQKEIIFSDQHSLGEIYKIHGCISQPESLVLTSDDYEQFIQNNHYLNSKILTLFVDYPIIFIGYSLSDPNIESILKNIVDCLDNDFLKIDILHNRLFFVEWQRTPCDPTIESSTYSLSSFSIPIKKMKVHGYSEIFEVLSEIPRKFPLNVLKQLQGMVYDFVMTTEPTNRIMVNGLDELDKIDNLEVVVGFGNISKLKDKGVVGLKDIDLIKDILFDDLPKENYSEIVQQLLPSIIRKKVFIPFFKYQKHTNNLKEDNALINFTNDNFTLINSQNISIIDYRLPNQISTMARHLNNIISLEDLIINVNLKHALQRIPYLSIQQINIQTLRTFLKNNWDNVINDKSLFSSFRKCVCLLDFLENTNRNQ